MTLLIYVLTVFSLIPVWFVMTILTVVMTGYFYLAMCLLCLLIIIMLKITYKS